MCYVNIALTALGFIIFAVIVLSLIQGSDDDSNPECVIIWFHRPGCGFCTRMNDEWEMFTSQAPNYVKVLKINASDPKYAQMAKFYEVNGVPHIVKEKNGRRSVFEGPRKASEFMKFALN